MTETEALAAIAALHVPTYRIGAEAQPHRVVVTVDLYEPSEWAVGFLASHECVNDPTAYEVCDPANGEHYALACISCGGITDEGEEGGSTLWPCDTAQLLMMVRVVWHPTGSWRAVAANGELWCESSDEAEVRRMARPADVVEQMYEKGRVTRWGLPGGDQR